MFFRDERKKSRSWLAIGLDLALLLSKNLKDIAKNYARKKKNELMKKIAGISLISTGSVLILVGAIIFFNEYFGRIYSGFLICGAILLIVGLIVSMRRPNY